MMEEGEQEMNEEEGENEYVSVKDSEESYDDELEDEDGE